MSVKRPNTICKNINCHKGEDGGRKHYYTCRYCVHSENWRAMACSEECYTAYQEQVKAARTHGKTVNTYPERTDMSHEEVVDLVENGDLSKVIEETNAELADELSENPGTGYGEIVDLVNQHLDNKRKKK